jgi:hypothetical protein
LRELEPKLWTPSERFSTNGLNLLNVATVRAP